MISSAEIYKAGILIVDDQDANVSLLEQMLKGAGYLSIASTKDPRTVCELHRKNRYSLILLDLQMPGLDGFKVMEELKTIETGGYLPVLVQTAQPDHKLRALKAGARDFVSKPFDLAEVLIRVHNMIEVRLLYLESEMLTQNAEASEKMIRASEHSYRRLFEAAQDGILILDVSTGRITDVNPFLVNLLGFPVDEIIGKTVGELSPQQDIESNKVMLERLQQDGYVRYEDLPLKTKDGRSVAAEFVCNVYRSDDKQVIQCNVRDITDRKATEKQLSRDASEVRKAADILKTHADDLEREVLVRTAELQVTINELEAFSYTVSHDLRAPLRAMQGYSHALLEDFSGQWGDEERHLLGRINKASERLDIMIQHLLTYSKVSKRHQVLTPVNLDRLVQDILTQYPTFQDPKLNIKIIHPLARMMGNESGITQIISNILTNAVKFLAEDRPPCIRIWSETKGTKVRLWIEDNGIGIDPKHHTRIFKMFEQVDGKKYEGTGMGLAIAAKGVESMHGTIGMESELGTGTKMWIELPGAP